MGFSIWELLIVLVIVVLLFGTRKLRNMGGDLGAAIRSFRQAMNSQDKPEEGAEPAAGVTHEKGGQVIEGEKQDQDASKV
ncbi:MAG: twin-arginine translocase TatA/TatE family subunit [Gammaproteobacteria bacterium]|nr:MAG: twin-arginine translocase TatA/TatE family subunit [Gammaproteobacteria bacterium]